MKYLLSVFTVVVLLLSVAPSIPAQVAVPAIFDDWYTTLDTTFMFGRVVPEGILPTTGTLPFRRAEALSLLQFGNGRSQILTYDVVNDNLNRLFRGWSGLGWYEMKEWLRNRYTIDIDSAECAMRGIEPRYIDSWDTVSFNMMDYFSARARQAPILLIPSVEGVSEGSGDLLLEIWRNSPMPIGGFATKISSPVFWDAVLDSSRSENGFAVITEKTDATFRLGGLRTFGGGVDSAHFQAARFVFHGPQIGQYELLQEESAVADTSGMRDFWAWPMRSFWLMYDRYDVNRNFSVTLADAVMCSRLVLRGLPAPIRGLGDVNYNNMLDADDPWIILRRAMQLGKTTPRNSQAVLGDTSANGTLRVRVGEHDGTVTLRFVFDGTLGESKRFGGVLGFETSRLRFDAVEYLQNTRSAISGYAVDGSTVRILYYPETFVSGAFLTVRFSKTGEGGNGFSLDPLVANYFSFGEKVRVVFEADGVDSSDGGTGGLPYVFALNQNYPNPFNNTTHISYSLPEASVVSLRVFSLLGNQALAIAEGWKERGEHEATLEGDLLSTGIYFLELRAGGNRAVRRMILMK